MIAQLRANNIAVAEDVLLALNNNLVRFMHPNRRSSSANDLSSSDSLAACPGLAGRLAVNSLKVYQNFSRFSLDCWRMRHNPFHNKCK